MKDLQIKINKDRKTVQKEKKFEQFSKVTLVNKLEKKVRAYSHRLNCN